MCAPQKAMATLLITIGTIWMFCALLIVLALCGVAARPLPKIDTTGPLFDCFDEEEIASSAPLVSQPATLH
jgi:hypothetical protein